ncbi:MAG: nucleotide exchange factor GrpE, partial [Candidatus Omnitrophica bacterium]|nr:nucleotide exchange factor GrpE [Candidatus Omnitrophota bacterium]
KIVEEVHTGYTMHDKVIRPAMVKVAKKQQTADSIQHTEKENGTHDPRHTTQE